MNRQFAGTRVVGCTTAGEIGPAGYIAHSLTGLSLPAGGCAAETAFLDHLEDFELARGQAVVGPILQQLEAKEAADPDKCFAFLLIDGLSVREEAVARTLQNALGGIPLIGGSAADDLKFHRTWIFHEGAFHRDAAVLILVNTAFPFKIFKTQHFATESERLVVTKADAAHRLVKEINGLPATEEYARLIGVPMHELTPACFAAAPVVVLIDGTDYVRSIQKANPDGSLSFYSAIDEGLVLRVARGKDLLADLEMTFAAIHDEIGAPQLVLACDCILRNLESGQKGLTDMVAEIFRRNKAVGFSTYGEQFFGVHINQTLTGIAIGKDPEAAEDDLPTAGDNRTADAAAAEERTHRAAEIASGPTPADEAALRSEIQRLKKIINALMNRAEAAMGAQGSDFGMFQTAIQLENQIRTRTRELEASQQENERINRALQRANRELEAFSYSVAHDLRAPLRAIDGFSAILQRNHADQLDAEGCEHLRRVREGAQRMGQLIDDLLHLSRCSRADLHREQVDLAALARQIISGFRQSQPERQIEFVVPDTLPAQGDSRLLAVLLENLLGNAWKYSRRRPDAHVEFGYDPQLSAYYIRDNGAGFDMAYAGKLFQVFQRLHTAAEFEGTGIGLAIVQRIVERHGGRVWAEGKVNEGATFHFTLPGKTPSAESSRGQPA